MRDSRCLLLIGVTDIGEDTTEKNQGMNICMQSIRVTTLKIILHTKHRFLKALH